MKSYIADDMKPYSKGISPLHLIGVSCIGWVDINGDYSKGLVPEDFVSKLKEIYLGNNLFNAVVEPVRSLPNCPACGRVETKLGNKMITDEEIWVPSVDGNEYFAAPSILIHLIEAHKYLPPGNYIEAVLQADLNKNFNGDEVYRNKLEQSGWYESDQFAKMREEILNKHI